MQTVFHLKVSDLGSNFIKSLQALFEKNEELKIRVERANDFGLNKKETKKEYQTRLKKAIDNVEQGKNMTIFTIKEFEEFAKKIVQ